MLKIGELNNLKVLSATEDGMILGVENSEEVFLDQKNIISEIKIGSEIEVFVYRDMESRLVASTITPKIALDSFACLKVVDHDEDGVFFDMGLDIDLFVPEEEQNSFVNVGDKRIVYMILNEHSEMLLGSMNWSEFCFNDEAEYERNQEVEIMIGEKTDLGWNVLIEKKYDGLVYANEVFEKLNLGDEKTAYIKSVREDGNIDVSLQKLGYGQIASSSNKILELLNVNNGLLEIGDKSSPHKIRAITGMSKRNFKKAIGDLYKKKLVVLEKESVKLNAK